MKKIIILSLIIIISISAIFAYKILSKTPSTISDNNILDSDKIMISTSMDYPMYENITDLSNKATDIILGSIIDVRLEEINILEKSEDNSNELLNPSGAIEDSFMLFTVFTIQIKDVFKGKHGINDKIEIKQLGGETDKFIHITDSQINLNDYVFFIESYEKVPADILNPIQSVYISDNSIEYFKISLNTPLESVHKANDLTLTYMDLLKIAKNEGISSLLMENQEYRNNNFEDNFSE